MAHIPFCVFIGFICVRSLQLRRLELRGDRLRISSFITSFEVPIQEVEQVYWIQEPSASVTPEAALSLKHSSPLGREIRFTPRSEKMVELVQRKLSACDVVLPRT